MPPRNRPNPNQGSLLIANEQTGNLYPYNSVETPPIVTGSEQPAGVLYDPNPGPSVNLLERNAHMQNMVRRLGLISRTTGFQIASDIGLLDGRYRSVDSVVARAVDKKEVKAQEAKSEYNKAFGLEAMIGSGLITRQAAEAMASTSYGKEVIPTFADSRNAKRRDVQKSWLNYQERSLTGKKTRRPKAPLPEPPEVV